MRTEEESPGWSLTKCQNISKILTPSTCHHLNTSDCETEWCGAFIVIVCGFSGQIVTLIRECESERTKSSSRGQINRGLGKLFFNETHFATDAPIEEPLQSIPLPLLFIYCHTIVVPRRVPLTAPFITSSDSPGGWIVTSCVSCIFCGASALDPLRTNRQQGLSANSNLINWRQNIYATKEFWWMRRRRNSWPVDWFNLRVPLMKGFAEELEGHNLCSFAQRDGVDGINMQRLVQSQWKSDRNSGREKVSPLG